MMNRKVVDMSDFCKDLEPLHASMHYVAYIDVLGTKNIVKNDKDDNYLNDLNNIYHNALKEAKENNNIDTVDVVTKIFSDNIIFAIKLDKDDKKNKEKLSKILHLVGHMQTKALLKGYLVRGAITKGNFCANELFINGQALIDAYTMEENNAIYPRIVLQESLVNIPASFIEQDKDGMYYVNSYHFSTTAVVILAKEALLKILHKYHSDSKVKQKILWAISYHNQYVNILLSKNVPELMEHAEDIITNEAIINAMRKNTDD